MYATIQQANELLEDAYNYNRGNWREHSKNVAFAAQKIAEHIKNMDSEKAYSLGLLHDIGRIRGVTHMKHVIDGYQYLENIGLNDNARICLTHSFPIKNVSSYSGPNDCNEAETRFISNYIMTYDYDNYDKLIQLCDAIALPNSICILEKRLLDVAIRNGINEYSIEKWKAFLNLKKFFDDLAEVNVYKLFEIEY